MLPFLTFFAFQLLPIKGSITPRGEKFIPGVCGHFSASSNEVISSPQSLDQSCEIIITGFYLQDSICYDAKIDTTLELLSTAIAGTHSECSKFELTFFPDSFSI